jgi:hypothetical protein
VTACLLNLMVSGGIAAPSVAQPLWIVAALALNAVLPDARTAGWPLRHRVALFLPLPVVACVILVFGLVVLNPVLQAASSLDLVRIRHRQLNEHSPTQNAAKEALQLVSSIGHHLKEAREADPYDTRSLVQSAQWSLELAEKLHNAKNGDEARKFLARAHELDPLGVEPLRLAFELHLRLAEGFDEHRKENLSAAVALIAPVVECDPTLEAQLHFRLAATYYQLKDRQAFQQQAELALRNDAEAPGPTYKLPVPQLAKLKEWLRAPPQKPGS